MSEGDLGVRFAGIMGGVLQAGSGFGIGYGVISGFYSGGWVILITLCFRRE